MSIKERTKKVFGYMAVRVVDQVMSLLYDWRGAKKKFCEVGVANCLLKSWRKTSAYEVQTFQYGFSGDQMCDIPTKNMPVYKTQFQSTLPQFSS